jgi:hypothetical protein
MQKRQTLSALANFMDKRVKKFAAAHNPTFQNYILFERFQIELPRGGIGIILRPTGAYPVGPSQYPNSELPS